MEKQEINLGNGTEAYQEKSVDMSVNDEHTGTICTEKNSLKKSERKVFILTPVKKYKHFKGANVQNVTGAFGCVKLSHHIGLVFK